MPVNQFFQASLDGIVMGIFPILWVILAALFLYKVTLASGAIEKIKSMLAGVSMDRRAQGLILAFGLGGFLEAVAGFGTAVAIPAGIMTAMGFPPLLAATVCLLANTIPVAFGVLGVPIITLAQVTELPLEALSLNTAFQLIPFVVLLPLVLIYCITGSFRHLRGILSASLLSGVVFALFQTLTILWIGPELAAVFGSLGTLLFLVAWFKLFPSKESWLFKWERGSEVYQKESFSAREVLIAWFPYLLILILVVSVKFLPFLYFLNEPPFTISTQFYFGEGGKPQVFNLATSGGTILFLSALLGGLIQGMNFKKVIMVLVDTCKQMWKTTVTVLFIVAMAKVMGYSGMVSDIAAVFMKAGSLFPFISPLIGALGTFLTGSDTSSNVLFGNLQKQTALNLNMNPEWLTASNASGATAGKMISPQSISIAATATGLKGEEGNIMRNTLVYCIIYVVLMGAGIFLFQ